MIPIVMSGGSGTRLWPVSRAKVPKQFCEIFDESLQLKTIRRLQPLGSPWILTVRELQVLTENSLRTAGVDLSQAIYEPFGRNTAPAIALACWALQKKRLSDEVTGIFPADQLVQNEARFTEAIGLAVEAAKQGKVVTLGVQPTYAATGFGYIEIGEQSFLEKDGWRAVKAEGFREKPDAATAQKFIAGGKHFWNAGIFVFQVRIMIQLLEKHAPEIWRTINELQDDLANLDDVYARLPSISIDYAVMEKLEELICVPADIGWSDVGSWEEIGKLLPEKLEQVIEEEAQDCFVFPQDHKVYGLIGVKDLVVVDTPDALLISAKGKSQLAKNVVARLQEKNRLQATDHLYEFRPWGKYEILSDRDDFKAKVTTVEAGQRLSYQSHDRRSEHWIVLSGSGEVTVNDQVRTVRAGDYIHIPLKAKHRMSAGHGGPLVFFEVQTGDYFGEDDIVRYQDDYRR
jgi:mannose-1-phosphate guanylyltransferase/mannose-1-phosphate guanylyltransferase/mannose-6-phosphate isomerase